MKVSIEKDDVVVRLSEDEARHLAISKLDGNRLRLTSELISAANYLRGDYEPGSDR